MTVLNDASPARPALANLIAAARAEAKGLRVSATQEHLSIVFRRKAERWERLADDAEREAEA